MKYFYWLGIIILVAAGLYISTQVEIQPPAVEKIKFTQFQQPEDLGKAIYETLRLEIKESPIVFLGVTPNQIEDMELWRGFLAANSETGSKYDIVIVEPMLPYVELLVSNMRIDIKAEPERFIEGVKKAREQGLRVAVIVPTIYSSQAIERNPATRFKDQYKLDFMSLSAAKFPVTEEQEVNFEPRCVLEQGVDVAGTGTLGCMVRQAARKTYRLKTETGKYSGLMEKTGAKDYLILLNRN
ncbi:hypothetical protein D3C87_89960 [compost metagenome]